MTQPSPLAEIPATAIETAHRRTTLIVGAIAFSLVIYVIIVELLRRMQPDATPIVVAPTLRIVFFAVAVLAIFLATITKSMLLQRAPATPVARLMRLQMSTLIAVAFAELPAVFGVTWFIMTRNRGEFYMLLVVSAYMIVRHFPRRETWESYVRRGSDAR